VVGRVRQILAVPPVPPSEAAVIQLMLDDANLATVKAGLQRACERLEAGQAFIDSSFLVIALHVHSRSPDPKVRRWAYKLALRLQDDSILPVLLEQFRFEQGVDAENRSWAGAAYFGLAPRVEVRRLVRALDQEFYQTPLELAALLYRRGEPLNFGGAMDLKSFESEALSRKWLCILCGYAMVDARTIDKRFSDLDLARNAVTDTDPEVVEYSIWALHRHPRGNVKKLMRTPYELMSEGPNVRRWLYRLLTKTEMSASKYLDEIVAAMSAVHEPAVQVREGLALGFGSLKLPKIREQTARWFGSEVELRVKLALVDHLAPLAAIDTLARDVLVAEHSRHPETLLAHKIESVLPPSMLVSDRAMMAMTPQTDQLDLPFARPLAKAVKGNISIVQIKEVYMSNDRIVNVVGNNNNLVGTNLGEMIASTITAFARVQDQSVAKAIPDLKRFLESLDAENIDPDQKALTARAAKDAADAQDERSRKSKFQTLKLVVQGLLAAPGATQDFIDKGRELMNTITGLWG
jgi:hypothetical protein